MKKGINMWSFPGSMKVEQCIAVAKKAGFDGIELALNETGQLSLESKESEIKEYRKIAEDQGIALSSLASGLYWTYSLTSGHAQTRQKAKDIVKKQLENAAILGVDTILVVPGAVGVDFIPDSEVVPYDQAYDYALEGISELSNVAQSLKVSIGIENVWNKFLLSPLEMRDFIDKINSPYVGAYFDVGNVLYAGYPEHWISILNKRIKKVHFKDYRRAAGGLHGFVDLLAGDVNYPEVMKALQAIGYDDYVIAEMIPGYTHHGEQIIYNTSGAMDAILGRK
ncbi:MULTISPECIES: sugar phosphate isomerase/epimerase [unclassified Paenibacillus]|uniref:sugar phosphate isomerase/epimerase family protein n=1 Tax=unclassified Paenibacillus TaxID=185978 RepID=UPI00278B5084|nr:MULTISPECIES: sugar phosphate isomerase/epimerase family protein [unclassified Paenibacillus]MDQ0897300.1 L-ribulose-5-phosphate 3-epimerase [Paenibacillus sp. V4I7]MDQ0916554.1 L-ribulose-5-phosphate 3-epimerase [Paenibacillus sp. V4I5]